MTNQAEQYAADREISSDPDKYKKVKAHWAKPEPKPKQADTTRKVSAYCQGCIYLGGQKGINYCNYFIDTHQRRPCPAGDGCTVREKRKGAKGIDAVGIRAETIYAVSSEDTTCDAEGKGVLR